MRTALGPPPPPRRRLRSACLALLLAALPLPAHAAWSLALRVGGESVAESDLRLEAPGGTDLTLRDVRWESASWDSPVYGVALTRWSDGDGRWGFGLDLTHAEAVLQTDDSVRVQGRAGGVPVDGPRRVGDLVPSYQLAHGLNTVTANAYRRFEARRVPSYPGDERSGVALYLGLGAGVSVPHVDATLGGVQTSEYQLGGPALRGLVGLEVPLDEHIALVGEGTLTWARVRSDLVGGERLESTFVVPQLSLGISLRD